MMRASPRARRADTRLRCTTPFRALGVAVGAVVAKAWSDGGRDAATRPTLGEWKQTAGLPWFGFWARELLRWGTHDPFVAFCLSQGLAQTREAAAQRRPAFETWLDDEIDDVVAEDRIDPQHFQQWQTSLARHEPDAPEIGRASCREQVCQYVLISVAAVSLKKKKR